MPTPQQRPETLNIANCGISDLLELPRAASPPSATTRTLAIPVNQDDLVVRQRYRPFLLHPDVEKQDWISQLDLGTVMDFAENDLRRTNGDRLRFLVLTGSLRVRSFSRLLSFECARILHRLGADVRVYDSTELPLKDDIQHNHPKVKELRELSSWSNGHLWISPEQHGTITGIFKNQIDWIPLQTESLRPTQGRTLAVAEVSGGSQSFNAVNALRILGRWMRMFIIPNQSSVPKAYTQFTASPCSDDVKEIVAAEGGDRMLPSSNRERIVDCMEELVKYTIIIRQHANLFNDRYSERLAAANRKEGSQDRLSQDKSRTTGVDMERL